MPIVGTAGHVDHGKSALVRALTGTEPDRWIEEQRRGMTLDLGFARLRLPDGREAGVIDVPGHERFLHNMLAGAAGMDVVLLVVAANEGVMPQTREHLAILRYLNVRRTIVVLSKADTLAAGDLAAAGGRVRAELRATIADGAPLVAVSALAGTGLDTLRASIGDAFAALPERVEHAPVYLPVDRVFALPGHGTIVTGTLVQGRIGVGDTLALSSPPRDVRVRRIQVFGETRTSVVGGTRVALNIPNVDRTEIARGAVLADEALARSARVRVRFEPLPEALPVLRRRTPVRAYIGSAEILATLVFARIPERAGRYAAELLLRTATVVVPGGPFVVRRLSPMDVLGGGVIESPGSAVDAPGPDADVDVDQRERSALLETLAVSGIGGAAAAQAGASANIAEPRAAALLDELVADGRAMLLAKPRAYVAESVARAVLDRALERLEARQRERPWLMGMTSLALANALGVAEPALVRVLGAWVDAGAVGYRAGYYATLDFTPRLSREQQAFFERLFGDDRANPGTPVPFEELRASMRASAVADVALAFETLLARGALAKVGDFVYRGAHIRTIRARLETALGDGGAITVAEFRDLTGTSRKYAVPLLEFFDATGVTIRTGDLRVLRRGPVGAAGR